MSTRAVHIFLFSKTSNHVSRHYRFCLRTEARQLPDGLFRSRGTPRFGVPASEHPRFVIPWCRQSSRTSDAPSPPRPPDRPPFRFRSFFRLGLACFHHRPVRGNGFHKPERLPLTRPLVRVRPTRTARSVPKHRRLSRGPEDPPLDSLPLVAFTVESSRAKHRSSASAMQHDPRTHPRFSDPRPRSHATLGDESNEGPACQEPTHEEPHQNDAIEPHAPALPNTLVINRPPEALDGVPRSRQSTKTLLYRAPREGHT